jgi:redox-sensitive bicupin YhaK (pirin superfamily)
MLTIRKAGDRGQFDHGWLKTHHTFSFGHYFDSAHMGLRSLRVLNDDWVQPGQGFGMHPHRDMEIVTYILQGALEHKDSMGNGSVIKTGQLQRITAGTGVLHSEFNPSKTDWVHLYQIWLLPNKKGLTPGYEELVVNGHQELGKLRLVASPDGDDGSLTIHQDARIYIGSLDSHQKVSHAIERGRAAWLQILDGNVNLAGEKLETGDGAAITGEDAVALEGSAPSQVMLFDLA